MKIIRELDQSERDALMEKYKDHRLLSTHIGLIPTAAHTYRVNLYAHDLFRTYAYPCLPDHKDPYQTIDAITEYIRARPEFLETSDTIDGETGRYSGILSGAVVGYYMQQVASNLKHIAQRVFDKWDCFVLDVPKRNRPEVLDAMHRLVAYCTVVDYCTEYFPIKVYLGVNRPLSEIEYLEG